MPYFCQVNTAVDANGMEDGISCRSRVVDKEKTEDLVRATGLSCLTPNIERILYDMLYYLIVEHGAHRWQNHFDSNSE